MALVRAAQGTSSDSNTRRGYHYDVFLRFRGKDTRRTFTDHLYTALNNAGFLTFRDDDELDRGEYIKLGLQKAIRLSRTSVVVLSKYYASSKWCLDGLVMILERKRTTSDHLVLPIFYDVNPSHMRKQRGSIGKAFARHEKTQLPNTVRRWRKALVEVADLAGMVLLFVAGISVGDVSCPTSTQLLERLAPVDAFCRAPALLASLSGKAEREGQS